METIEEYSALSDDAREDLGWKIQTEYEERGGRPKKGKKQHQGKVTLKALERSVIQNSVKNAAERLKSAVAEEINPDIEVTISRLISLDRKDPGLPDLREYANWLLKIFHKYEEGTGEERDPEETKRESVVSFSTSGGPGGQNVNKRETAVRIVHLPTGMWLEERGQRTQIDNRKEAESRMKALVEEHIDKWMEIMTDPEAEGAKTEVAKKIKEVVGNRFEPGQPGKHTYKSEDLRRLIQELETKK